MPFQLTDNSKARSPSWSVVSKPQSWDGQCQEGSVTPPFPPLDATGQGACQLAEKAGREAEGRSKGRRHRQKRHWRKAANEGTQSWRNGFIQASALTHKRLTQGHSASHNTGWGPPRAISSSDPDLWIQKEAHGLVNKGPGA